MLYGREAEMRRIDSLLESVRAGKSGVLVLRGEAGIGKTALLGYATERSSGMTVLRARGIETEARLAFSGLADLFRPVIDRLALIPSPQSAALAGALGLGPPVAGDRFVVCIATLSILAAAAEVRPVLVVVDDSHWLDEASREALFFAARRLEAEHVALVATATDSTTIELGSTGLEELVISGLDPGPCLDLLSDQVSSPVAPDVANRLCLATRGNPLALREVVSQLSKQQLSGEDHLQDPLPAAETVENALIRDLQQLPGETRTALVVSAASSGSLSTVIEACRLLGISASALEVAEQAGVIRDEDDLIVFSHPLVRAAVYHAALKTERVRAHTALADALELQVDDEVTFDGPASAAERRSWQLAAAALRPSERVATALEQTAMSARSRSGYAASAYALERAAELTPRTQDRARRLLAAGRDWQLAGQARSARMLLTEALALTADLRERSEIEHLRAQVEMSAGEFAHAYRILAAGARKVAAVDEAKATLMLADASFAAVTVGEVDLGLELARDAQSLGRRAGGTAEIVGDRILGATLVIFGETKQGAPLVLRSIPPTEGEALAPVLFHVMPVALMCLEEFDTARKLIDRLIATAQSLPAPTLLVPALAFRAELAYLTGDWLAAYADAGESLRLGREFDGNVLYALVYGARLEAARGLELECRQHAGEALELGERLGIGGVLSHCHALLGRLELGLGHIGEAIVHLEEADRLAELHRICEPNVLQHSPDMIEAYLRAGRQRDAARILERLDAQAEKTGRTWAVATASRCRGLLARERDFAAEFEHALACHAQKPRPFERARTELCYGERLRRARRRTDARVHLRAALATFERLDAVPWIARARAELAATGETVRAGRKEGVFSLTAQELQLALIVGRGATNKEASATLFVSPKTVEAHLHRIYVKLGIRSRTELARHLAREQILD